tara:strand:+ start:130 stop:372 length:243 start_codon:yes stop_codon:yes gene_type:complete
VQHAQDSLEEERLMALYNAKIQARPTAASDSKNKACKMGLVQWLWSCPSCANVSGLTSAQIVINNDAKIRLSCMYMLLLN